jgi:hypothetical protein
MEAIVQAARVVRQAAVKVDRRSGMEHYDLLSRSLYGILAFFGQIVGSAESDYAPSGNNDGIIIPVVPLLRTDSQHHERRVAS